MKAVVCPAVTARSAVEYSQQMQKVAPFVRRVHIDLADGMFTPVKLTPIQEVWWPGGVRADIHVMYQQPFKHTKDLLALEPNLIVVHAEADGDFLAFADAVHAAGVKVGVALKPETMPRLIEPALDFIDHVLIFSGQLGRFGGEANTHLLTKVLYLKRQKPQLEISWDGGINNKNIAVLAAGGVDVLNVGGFIQHAADPHAAYNMLEERLRSLPHHKRV